MTPIPSLSVPIQSELDVAFARQLARRMAEQAGFKSAKVYRLETAVSELAHNLHAHALPGGNIGLAIVEDGERIGVEIVAEDKGPGIADIELAMQDGYSTNRGLGSGLPGARRLMDEFSIKSELGSGTRIVARLWRL